MKCHFIQICWFKNYVKKYIFHCINKIQIIDLVHLGCFQLFARANIGTLNVNFWCTYPSVLLRGELHGHWKCISLTSQNSA